MFGTVLSSRIGKATVTLYKHLHFTRQCREVLRSGDKYYIYFVDNSRLFPTVKELKKNQLTIGEVIVKAPHHDCFKNTVYHYISLCTERLG